MIRKSAGIGKVLCLGLLAVLFYGFRLLEPAWPRVVGGCVVEGQPERAYVPDQATAIRIAEAILMPIYGEEKVKSERPFRATLTDGQVWVVRGSLPGGRIGGVATVKISKEDGCIFGVSHGK